MNFTLKEILEASEGQLLQESGPFKIKRFCSDSRQVEEGDFFVCLKGENFDGHLFIEEAVKKGAVAVLMNQSSFQDSYQSLPVTLITCADTLMSYGNIARAWRRKFTIPVVAIAGSNGKTTTKDLCAAILSSEYDTLSTQGNLNNLVGVPQTLLSLNEKHTAAVIEIGMNDFGENKRLTEIVEPTLGLITNIGYEHLEKLKNLEGVARAESELFEAMPSGTLALFNLDDLYISKMNTKAFKMTFGSHPESQILFHSARAISSGLEINILYLGKHYVFESPLNGTVGLKNSLAAISVGLALGIESKKIQKGLKQFQVRPMRMEVKSLSQGKTLLNDCYNANPSSMREALYSLKEMAGAAPCLAILGEMKELGDFSLRGHEMLGEYCAEFQITQLIAISPWSKQTILAAKKNGMLAENCFAFTSQEEAKELILNCLKGNDYILVKGSRGAKMEKVTEYLLNEGKGN